jgi:glycosyltransferase involved in cell wall biosynthesis
MKGIPDDAVATVYNAFDVLTSVSMGEGFGIPIVEAQANGVPVIVGDWTSMSELCFAGWKVDRADADNFWTPLGSYQFVPHVGAIAEAMEAAYLGAQDFKLHKQARQGALAYNADDVAETYWRPILSELEQRMDIDDNAPTYEQAARMVV